MAKCWIFLARNESATQKPKLMDSWTDGRTHEMTTIPIGIDVSWGHVIWIYQHAKLYAFLSKWFVSKCVETWKCGKRTDREKADERTEGQTVCRKVLLCPSRFGRGTRFKNVTKSLIDALTFTLDLWPGKDNRVREISVPMCVSTVRIIHRAVLVIASTWYSGWWAAGDGRWAAST